MSSLIRNENGSKTITHVMDECGAPRSIIIHGYKVASSLSPALSITIMDHKNKALGNVILHKCEAREIMNEIMNMI